MGRAPRRWCAARLPSLVGVVAAAALGTGCGARTLLVDDEAGCGDGYCTWDEDAARCPTDCDAVCGDDLCTHGESAGSCPGDCSPTSCGNGACERGESALTCPADCDGVCGDGSCTHDEDGWSCPVDCGAVCGNGVCEGGESALSCPADCAVTCDDGTCDPSERPWTCPADCPAECGDGACTHYEDAWLCPEDCPSQCGDGYCTHDEAPWSCPVDCPTLCGDGRCDDFESAASCPEDCEPLCGDGLCTHDENERSCPEDCGRGCGDGVCSPWEDPLSCPEDCESACGDGRCDLDESFETCSADCPAPSPLSWQAGSFVDLRVDRGAAVVSSRSLTGGDGDDGFVEIPLGFDFPFYGESYSSARVSTNGYLTFGGEGSSWVNEPVGSPAEPNAFVAVLWDDLAMHDRPGTTERQPRILYATRGVAPHRHVVVQWQDLMLLGGSNFMTFEAILHEGGTIQTLYHDITGAYGGDRATGSGATIGIEDQTGARGVEHAFEVAGAIRPGTVLTYRPTGPAGTDYDLARSDDLVTEMIDIRGSGTLVSDLACDDCMSSTLPLGFELRFYGRAYREVVASSNGWIALGSYSGGSDLGNGHLPSTGEPHPLVACLWDDAYGLGGDAQAHYETVGPPGDRVFVLQLSDWHFCCTEESQSTTYQVRLHEATGLVECVYGALRSTVGGTRHLGGSATVGIQDHEGRRGVEVLFEEPRLETGARVAFYPADEGRTDYLAFGPDGSFVDIASTATTSTATGDDAFERVSIGFSFPYYDRAITQVDLTTNGQLNLAGAAAFSGLPLPSPGAPAGIMAPFWDDLEVRRVGQAIYYATLGGAGSRTFVAQWDHVSFLSDRDSDLTFQVRLHEGDGSIDFAYGPMMFGATRRERASGGSATVGLQDASGSRGLTCGHEDAGVALSGSAIRFMP